MDNESDKPASPQPEQTVENRRLKRLPKTVTPEPTVADTPSEPKPEPPPPVKIIDERLEEEDAKIVVTVSIVGRTQIIVDKLTTEFTLLNAFLTQNRSLVIAGLRRTFEDMFQATVTRFNLKVGVSLPEDEASNKGANGHGDKLFKEDLTPFKGDSLPMLHVDPDPGLKPPDQN